MGHRASRDKKSSERRAYEAEKQLQNNKSFG